MLCFLLHFKGKTQAREKHYMMGENFLMKFERTVNLHG